MSRCKNTKDRKLAMQGLEKREMMAGDVGVNLSNGVLNIEGDDAGNYVQVDQISEGMFKVSGLYSNRGTTKLNGQLNDLTFKGVNNINVEMADGRDQLNLNGTGTILENLKGDLNIDMGYGDDEVHIKDFWVNEDATINMDEVDNSWNAKDQGDDLLKATDFIVYGSLDVTTSEGADQVLFDVTGYGWNAFHEGFSLDTGIGTEADDVVVLNRVFTWKGIDIDTSDGDDTFYGKSVLAYEGNVTINTHDGNDNVTLLDSQMNWQLTDFKTSVVIVTGDGNDDVTLKNVVARGQVQVHTMRGNDDVVLHEVHAKDSIYANLGSGDDDLSVDNSSAAIAYLYGGSNFSGGDQLSEDDNVFGNLYLNGWE